MPSPIQGQPLIRQSPGGGVSISEASVVGLSAKASCRLATAAALPSNTYLAGVLTGVALAALTVDGVAVVAGDRILVKDEATAANNGIYVVSATGSGIAAYVLTRASDMNEGSEFPGAFSFVLQGTTNAGTGWICLADPDTAFVVGTTACNWTQFNSGGSVVYPWNVAIDVFATAIAATNWNGLNDRTVIHGGTMENNGSQNSAISFDVVLGAGTWQLELMHGTGGNVGIYTLDLDGAALTTFSGSATTIDGYAASGVFDTRTRITGIVIPTSIKRRLTLTMATKNASSSNFFGVIQSINFLRTA